MKGLLVYNSPFFMADYFGDTLNLRDSINYDKIYSNYVNYGRIEYE